jgi:hypothetical protein
MLRNGLDRWLPTAALRRRVLVDNPARLYGFHGWPMTPAGHVRSLAPSIRRPAPAHRL